MKCAKDILRLYAITDRTWLGEQTLEIQVEQALKGGVTCVQLREKGMEENAVLTEARKIAALCHRYGVPLLMNDSVDLAIRCGADGVHVGQHDMQALEARRRMGEHMLLGVSARTVEQAVLAERSGADYLGVGAVFGTATKLDAVAICRETVQEICAAVSIPVVAIGGISKENLLELRGTGVQGVALVSAIFSSHDIENECRSLRALSEKMTDVGNTAAHG